MKKKIIAFLFTFGCLPLSVFSQNIYFPPILNQTEWETQSLESLGWCPNKVDSLYQFLEQENSKAFLLLKDGRIVLERYFGTFTADSTWYWASAGKTLTAYLVAKAVQDQMLNLDHRTNQYLPIGWSSCPVDKENLISIRNQLTMTTGLDDGVPDPHCTISSCLQYLADAGSRWAYHNAPYTLLEKVIESSTGSSLNVYTQSKLKNQTGMSGLWISSGYNNLFVSRARSMARFGLLVQNGFKWTSNPLLTDSTLLSQMTNTSQQLNLSYGYLWWLNGKNSYKLPGSQITFPGPLSPQAPMDMVAALGKNGQILCISKEKGLVLVRMGNAPTGPGAEVPNVFVNEIWKRVNQVICTSTDANHAISSKADFRIWPNPAFEEIHIEGDFDKAMIYNSLGQKIREIDLQNQNNVVSVSSLSPGQYWILIQSESRTLSGRPFVKR